MEKNLHAFLMPTINEILQYPSHRFTPEDVTTSSEGNVDQMGPRDDPDDRTGR
jgi:hypothetical protein